ncbi:MAG: gliding motility-associated C-terminal domain-containing protein [Flavobacteriales bacterium]|nr:gliding motility-associated C-terminal domain-containing protein [Flavobacteriales bacterium]
MAVALSSWFWASATHIMGGEFYYEYLAKDSFRFTFVYYIDCVHGNAGAISDDKTAFFGFFNAKTKDLIKTVEVTRSDPERVSKLNYLCIQPPSNACVDKYLYTFEDKISIGSDGLVVTFQRCCRNSTITNLIDPLSTGMTIFAEIPAVVEVNSNPVFKDNPPNFLCNDAKLIFDHSAFDKDGDSLVYDLYIPFLGASNTIPRPTTPDAPHYQNVVYKTAYHLGDLMGGTEKLKIDSKTGILTVKPDAEGQYVVGIRVSEYRNGVKIGETLRDYQFNVLQCNFTLEADFKIPETICMDSILFLKNTSQNANSYHWTITNPTQGCDTSVEDSPEISFSQSGVYQIKLVAKNLNCIDSITQNITIKSRKTLYADFDITPDTICLGDTAFITKMGTETPDWFWDVGYGEMHNFNFKRFVPDETGERNITLKIVDSVYCLSEDSITKKLFIQPIDTFEFDFDFEVINTCDSTGIFLNKKDDFKENWNWNISGFQDNYENFGSVFLENLTAGKIYDVSLIAKDSRTAGHCFFYKPKTNQIKWEIEKFEFEPTTYNVFTPNQDYSNDCYFFGNDSFECVKAVIWIYNRWGELMFTNEKNDFDCWDGKYNGKICASGTYFGIIKYFKGEEEIDNRSVTITLIGD